MQKVSCWLADLQSQSITVDRQMRRYNVPRLAFINKLDRAGADPWRVCSLDMLPIHLQLKIARIAAYRGKPRMCGSRLSSWVQVIGQMQEKLRLHCAPVQLPIGLEDEHAGLIDLVKMKAFHFKGANGEEITEVHRSLLLQIQLLKILMSSHPPHTVLGIRDSA